MCGIASWLEWPRSDFKPEVAIGMAVLVRYRGPGGSGYFRDATHRVALACQ